MNTIEIWSVDAKNKIRGRLVGVTVVRSDRHCTTVCSNFDQIVPRAEVLIWNFVGSEL